MADMSVDPVSGNPIPPGGTAEGVRDDVNIRASEGEYVIPANVVRYLGLEKIEKMVAKAQQELATMEGEDDGQGELPFPKEELQVSAEEAPAPGMAEGGPVGNIFSNEEKDPNFTGVKQFKGPDGNIMYVPFMNGAPLFSVPDGYTENDPTAVSTVAPDPSKNVTRFSSPVLEQNDPSPNEGKGRDYGLADPVSEWTPEDFINFGKQKGSVADKAVKGMINLMPGGALALRIGERFRNPRIAEGFDQMLETGLDLQGNPLSEDQKVMLSQTRDQLKDDLSRQSGLNLQPISSLRDAVGQFMNFVAGRGPTSPTTMSSMGGSSSSPRSSVSSEASNMLNTRASPGYVSRPSSDGNRGEGDRSIGSGMGLSSSRQGGNPSDRESHNASTGSGGLYRKGGLVKKK